MSNGAGRGIGRWFDTNNYGDARDAGAHELQAVNTFNQFCPLGRAVGSQTTRLKHDALSGLFVS